MPLNIAIIGAGMAGLACAQALKSVGLHPIIYEKSRGTGGRISTRKTRDGYHFDHGAQYVTARSEPFDNMLQLALKQNAIAVISHSDLATRDNQYRYVGQPGMKHLVRPLEAGLDILFETEITNISRKNDKWLLSSLQFTDVEFDIVISTAPAPQTLNFAGEASGLTKALSVATYAPCWALMIAFKQAVPTQRAFYQLPDNSSIRWIARQSAKPLRNDSVDGWVAHASPNWSAKNLERDKMDVLIELKAIFAESLEIDLPTPVYETAHRWRYAMVDKPLGKEFISDQTNTFFAGGDWCLGPRVECAFQSGNAIATAIIASL